MCICDPKIKTPWCGNPGCEMPKQELFCNGCGAPETEHHYPDCPVMRLGYEPMKETQTEAEMRKTEEAYFPDIPGHEELKPWEYEVERILRAVRMDGWERGKRQPDRKYKFNLPEGDEYLKEQWKKICDIVREAEKLSRERNK